MRLFILQAFFLFSIACSSQSIGIVNNLVGQSSDVVNCDFVAEIDSLNAIASLPENTTDDVVFTGLYLANVTSVTSSCFTVNSIVYAVSDTLILNVTTGAGEQLCDISVTNDCGTSDHDKVFEIKNFGCTPANFTAYGDNYITTTAGQAVRTHNQGWASHGVFDNTKFIENSGEYIEFTLTQSAFVVGATYNSNPTGSWNEQNAGFYMNSNTNIYSVDGLVGGDQFTNHGAIWSVGALVRLLINTSNQIEWYVETGVGTGTFNLVRTSTNVVTGPLYPFGSSGSGTGATISDYKVCK